MKKPLACLLIASMFSCSESDPASVENAPTPTDIDAAPPAAEPEPPRSALRFTDVTAESGLHMVLTSGIQPPTAIVEVKGGGLGLIDFDSDGDLDVFVPNGATLDSPEAGPGARLFENLGDLRFRDVTEEAGISFNRWGMGVAVADYDNDHDEDIFIACFGPNALLENNGDGTFIEVGAFAGIDDDRWAAAATFGDVDADGDLDLYVVNYVEVDASNPPAPSSFKSTEVIAGPKGLPAQADILFRNNGDGTFTDISRESGIASASPAFGLNAIMLDFTGDDFIDILVGNDSMANFLFVGSGDGTFMEAGLRTGIASNIDGSEQATMGMAIADLDNNGLPDVFSTNFSSDTNTLHLNLDGRFFDDRTQQFGLGMVTRTYLGWAAGFYDFDLDMDEDLLVFNGHVYPQATMETMDSDYEQPPLLFERTESRFRMAEPATSGAWLAEKHRDRAAAFGDLDGDGDIDVVVGELCGPVRVLRNDADRWNWLIVELEPASQRFGAKVELLIGDDTQRRWVFSGGSFQSSSAPQAHFGVPADATSGFVIVTWPDGTIQRSPVTEFKRRFTMTKPH